MDSIVAGLLSYLLLYKYYTLFAVVFLGGLVLPLPANTLLLAAGAFASQGYFSLALSFTVAMIANVLGDTAGFTLTRAWKNRFVKKNYLAKIPYLPTLEGYVNRHAGLTILVTRFLGTPGSLVNFLAGLGDVSAWKFLVFDIIGNIFDIGLFLGVGYYLGGFTENLSDILSIAGWMLLIGVVIVLLSKAAQKKHMV